MHTLKEYVKTVTDRQTSVMGLETTFFPFYSYNTKIYSFLNIPVTG